MLNFDRILAQRLVAEPFQWAFIDQLFADEDARALAATFPFDNFRKVVASYGSGRSYEYLSRSLVHMGADETSSPEELSPAWRQLAADLLSREYRQAIGQITGLDIKDAPLEINVSHSGLGAHQAPHVDHKSKLVTQVFYFNEFWSQDKGGCINILRSKDESDVFETILPIVGNSVILVRSENSWHSVSPVVSGCRPSRRSMNAIFHLPGSISTMWPPGKTPQLFRYDEAAQP